jgi:hypothetical protein
MAKPHLQLDAPTTENRTVLPRRAKNADVRTREHLTLDEVERLIETGSLDGAREVCRFTVPPLAGNVRAFATLISSPPQLPMPRVIGPPFRKIALRRIFSVSC